MSDIETLQTQIQGLGGNLASLRLQKDLFIKAQGLDEEAEKARAEAEETEASLHAVKEEISELKAKKAEAMAPTANALSGAMSRVLPSGKGIFEISDAGIWIGWEKPNGLRVPYMGLSGGEKVAFDQALSFALLGDGEKILILEAAEMDPMHLTAALNHLSTIPEDTQIILNTWCSPAEAPPQWAIQVIK